jgi:uncharacterized protein (TIGR00730 family)
MGRMQRRRYELDQPDLDRALEELVEAARRRFAAPDAAGAPDAGLDPEAADYVRQMLVTSLRLLRDRASTGDLKLLNSALKELRHAFRVFAPYEHVRKVAVFGSARTQRGHPDWKQAHAFGERIARDGWMVITGAGGGIMGAAQGGAGRAASFGVNIRLPFEQVANETIAGDQKLINFRYFFTRKVTFVKEAHAIALFPGGFGTHDEGFEALTLIQTGKSEILPVVCVDEPGGSYWRDWERWVHDHLLARRLISPEDLSLFRITDDVEAAVAEVLGFYRNYHSARFVEGALVLRLLQAPSAEQLEGLNDEFGDLLEGGRIERVEPHPREGGELPELPRVALRYDRRRVGRVRELIDRLNSFVDARTAPVGATPRQIVPAPLSAAAERAELDDENGAPGSRPPQPQPARARRRRA